MSDLTCLTKVNVKGVENKRHQEESESRHHLSNMQEHISEQPGRQTTGETNIPVGSHGCGIVVGLESCWNCLLGWAPALQVGQAVKGEETPSV